MNNVSGKNLSLYMGTEGVSASGVSNKNGEKNSLGTSKNVSIYMGKQDNALEDRISIKREETRRKAMKLVKDQFAADSVATDSIKENQQKIEEYKEQMSWANEEINNLKDSQKAMKESYGITDDSQEQQDLDLIRKGNKALKEGRLGSLTKEEWEKVANLDMEALTPYQRKCLTDDIMEGIYSDFKDEAQKGITAASSANSQIKMGMLKQHGMADALALQDHILKAGSDEIIGMAYEDARKHMEEELEKLVEAAKKATEEKEEQKEKIEAAKAENQPKAQAETESTDTEDEKAITGDILDGAKDMEKMQQEVGKLLKESELLEEDMKGIIVNQHL